MVCPLNTIEVPLQIACEIGVVFTGFTITFNIKKLSQPKEVTIVSRYVPDVVIVWPLKVVDCP